MVNSNTVKQKFYYIEVDLTGVVLSEVSLIQRGFSNFCCNSKLLIEVHVI